MTQLIFVLLVYVKTMKLCCTWWKTPGVSKNMRIEISCILMIRMWLRMKLICSFTYCEWSELKSFLWDFIFRFFLMVWVSCFDRQPKYSIGRRSNDLSWVLIWIYNKIKTFHKVYAKLWVVTSSNSPMGVQKLLKLKNEIALFSRKTI